MAFYDKIDFMLQILINIIWQIKIKRKLFGISYHNHIFFHYYIFLFCHNDLIKLLQTFLVILLCRYKRYNICLISFFNLFELFLALICAKNIGSLVNSLFGVEIFNPVPVVFLFRGFSFTLSAIVSSGSNSTSSLSSYPTSSSAKCKSVVNSSGTF